MSVPLTREELDALLTSLASDESQADERYVQIRRRLVRFFVQMDFESLQAEALSDETIKRVARLVANGLGPRSDLDTIFFLSVARRMTLEVFASDNVHIDRDQPPAIPTLDCLRHHLQTHCPVLYARVLADTFADLRQEHSAALGDERPLKARWILLRGCCALATAAVCQLGSSFRGRLATLWQTRSLK